MPAAPKPVAARSLRQALAAHWPEYLIEAFCLGMFMIAAGVAATAMESPDAALHRALPDAFVRRALIGVVMGLTAIALIYCPWGRRSGAHMNPAVTLAFYRLGKVERWDLVFYTVAQFAGGVLGILVVRAILGHRFTQPPVLDIVTVPGPQGAAVAFAGEFAIATLMMLMVLVTGNHARLARWTGVFSGILIACFVAFEAPLSGFGMNPARTAASALPSGVWTAAWIYFIAPPLGMQLAVDAYRWVTGRRHAVCAKLAHNAQGHCIFHCGYGLPGMPAIPKSTP